MRRQFSENITRVIVREWLQSKNAVLDKILNGIVNELTPVAAEQAFSLIYESLPADPRDRIIQDLYESLNRLQCEVSQVYQILGRHKFDEGAIHHLMRMQHFIDQAQDETEQREQSIELDDVAAQAVAGDVVEEGGAP
jgi:hypothetical protein